MFSVIYLRFHVINDVISIVQFVSLKSKLAAVDLLPCQSLKLFLADLNFKTLRVCKNGFSATNSV